ncbi:unnamed protein product [Sphenostylis stenocarpa]|uniref:Uncharacterized protein n=1 Tax=Sphenostylis stenocarpa TaxID=92480 RepID=A0AA86VN48_9FABA|nr:unnamed protein product [Sphenostylis stenocarpa]
MDSKMARQILGLLAILLVLSSEVAARNLKEDEVVTERNVVGDADFLAGFPQLGGGYDYGQAGGGGPPTYGFSLQSRKMGSKTKIALLIPVLLAMLLLISPKVAMAASHFEEGETVKETNAVNGRLIDGYNIPDIVGGIVGGIVGSIISRIPGIGGAGGNLPGTGGAGDNLPVIGGAGGNFPGIVGGNIPVGGGGISGIGGSGYPGQGGYIGRQYCPYDCCVWALRGGYCATCCTI